MVQHQKAIVRMEMLAKRNTLSVAEKAERSAKIMDSLFQERHFRNAKCVAFYMSIGSEVDTKPMIERAIAEGKEVLLPVVKTDHHIELYRFESFDKMKKGRFTIPEPEGELPPTTHPGVVVLPGVSFGLCMHRLGYGKGYYDRLVAHLPSYRIGICFDLQVVEKLPRHDNDQRMDMIITEKRTLA